MVEWNIDSGADRDAGFIRNASDAILQTFTKPCLCCVNIPLGTLSAQIHFKAYLAAAHQLYTDWLSCIATHMNYHTAFLALFPNYMLPGNLHQIAAICYLLWMKIYWSLYWSVLLRINKKTGPNL